MVKLTKIFLTLVLCLSYTDYAKCILPLVPIGIGITASGLASLGYVTLCHFTECCTDIYIPANFTLLHRLLKHNLYGQHIARKSVVTALRSHFNNENPKKALTMSFHGLPGTGKNYVADFIVQALYKNGDKSLYVQNYRGNLDFRSDGLIEQYKVELQANITAQLKLCPRSIFIFDEVHKIPHGTLDSLVPFIDYHPKIGNVDATRAIYIFLSNTGASQIGKQLLKMWIDGKKREESKLEDFESLLALAAFNEKGGLHKSDTIESSLIDHYIPFLPLEKIHVRNCIINAYKRRGVDDPSNEAIDEVMNHSTFGPSPHNLYSNGGCKRIDQKVGSVIQNEFYDIM